MSGSTFNVYLGGTGENILNDKYRVGQLILDAFKLGDTQQGVDYVCYDGMDVRGEGASSSNFVTTLKNRKPGPGRPAKIIQINLIGWGYGAYEAIRLANELSRHFPKIKVNILALDPVPFSKNHEPQSIYIPSNVEHYVSLVTQHEYGLNYLSVIPKPVAPSKTNVVIKSIVGNHSDFMGETIEGETPNAPSQCLTRRAQRFVVATLNAWSMFSEAPSDDSSGNNDWEVLAQHREDYETKASRASVHGPAQPAYFKLAKVGERDMRYRMVYQPPRGRCFIHTLPEFQLNPPNPVQDAFFEICSDTCTLHRDYNDEKIANTIEDKLSTLELSCEDQEQNQKLYELLIYLQQRHETRGKDKVLESALNRVKARAKNKDIFLAACLGQIALISTNKAFLNSKNATDESPLMLAARFGHENFLRALILQRVDFLSTNQKKETALMVAAKYGQIGALTRLKVHYALRPKIDALVVAAKANQSSAVKALINDRDVTYSDHYLFSNAEILSLLIWAVDNQEVKIFNAFIQKNPELLHCPINESNETIIDYAKHLEREEIVKAATLQRRTYTWMPKPRTAAAAVGAVLFYGYSAAVYYSSNTAVEYGKFFETVLVANSLQAPVAVIAIVLAALATIAAAYLAKRALSPPVYPYASIEI